MPIAQVSLVDADVVTYPGNEGDPRLPSRLQRTESICAVAVYQPETTVFPNLHQQPCPWLSADAQKGLSFYASHPIQTQDGQAIGALCLIDVKPREFTQDEQKILQRMASIARSLRDLELLASPSHEPAIWTALESRIQLSLQRIETLTVLARWEESAQTPAARAYQSSLHEERLLILQDIEYQIDNSFARLGCKH